jgi:hypothetical protein
MRRFLPMITILFALAIVFVSATPAAAAQKLHRVAGEIERRGDSEVYSVYVGFGQVLYAVVDRPEDSRLNPYLRLYDSDGYLIWEDDDSAGNRNPYITYWPILPGRYYLEVSGYGSSTGEFGMVYGAFYPWGDSIDAPGEYDLHTFYGRRGDLVWIQTMRPADSKLDPYFVVVAPDGSELVYRDGPFGDPDATAIIPLNQTGNFRVYVMGEDYSVGDYTLLVTTYSED